MTLNTNHNKATEVVFVAVYFLGDVGAIASTIASPTLGDVDLQHPVLAKFTGAIKAIETLYDGGNNVTVEEVIAAVGDNGAIAV